MNDERNSQLYNQYKALAEKEDRVIFGGRLGEYKYYDMDQVIAVALEKAKELIDCPSNTTKPRIKSISASITSAFQSWQRYSIIHLLRQLWTYQM